MVGHRVGRILPRRLRKMLTTTIPRLGGFGADEDRGCARNFRSAATRVGGFSRSRAPAPGDPGLRTARGAWQRRVQGDDEGRGRGREGNVRGQGATHREEGARLVSHGRGGERRARVRAWRGGHHADRYADWNARVL